MAPLWAQRCCHPWPTHPLAATAAGSLRLICLGGGEGFVPPPSPVRPPLELPHSRWSLWGFHPPRATLPLWECWFPVATQILLPLPGGTLVGFPPLQRPRALPPCPPLRRNCGPFQRTRSPRCCPALPNIHRPGFPAGLSTSPFAPASPHGSPPLPTRRRPQRRLSRCCPRRPSRLPNACPRRFLVSPLPSPPAVCRPNMPPPWSSHPHLSPSRLNTCRSIRRFRLRSLLQPLPSSSTPPPAPTFLAWWPFPRLPPARAVVTIVADAAAVLVSAPRSPLVLPSLFPFLPPPPAPLPPPSLRLLRPLAPPRAPLPPSPAADIARKDKDVGDRTGGGDAIWSVAGGSAPRSKCTSRPLAVVGDGISRPRFLHRPQQ